MRELTSSRLDPLAIFSSIENSYIRYLTTSFRFRDAVLRESFLKALEAAGVQQGPFVEQLPSYGRGLPLAQLFAETLDAGVHDSLRRGLDGDRRLYAHQENAIRRALAGRNVVVATGTGSGKTECFLYPILLDLCREGLAGSLGPGVRALILYPMNALANDQRERLGAISANLAKAGLPFQFTFGQYIGQTPEDARDHGRHANEFRAARLPGELVFRDEMRKTPPHILLTNYSMLEYLLLRPKDTPLFDDGAGATWRYLVLDEAHQYRGAKGMEMSMLLRRLKQRVREGGKTDAFQCIATSATLSQGTEERARVADFAHVLFDEPFEADDVVLSVLEPRGFSPTGSLDAAMYGHLVAAIESGRASSLASVLTAAWSLGVVLPDAASSAEALGQILAADERVTRLERALVGAHASGTPVNLARAAEIAFPEVEDATRRRECWRAFTAVLLEARVPGTGAPLISLRYHTFLRALEGVFLRLHPEPEVLLDRASPSADQTRGPAIEVALCRECGQHYFVGREVEGRLEQPIRDGGDPECGVDFFAPYPDGSLSEVNDGVGVNALRLCAVCGVLRAGEEPRAGDGCGHHRWVPILRVERRASGANSDSIARCVACDYDGEDPVREITGRSDGPNSVIATALHVHLPPERRRVLAFADGRQDAAFFAWYVEDSYRAISDRALLLKALRCAAARTGDPLSLDEVSHELVGVLKSVDMPTLTSGSLERRRYAWRCVLREILTEERRISLEGLGLLQPLFAWPEPLGTPAILLEPPFALTDREARDLVFVLLDTLRLDRAVELPQTDGESGDWEILDLRAPQMAVRIGAPGGNRNVRSFDGPKGRRAGLLAKIVLGRVGSLDVARKWAQDALRHIFDAIETVDAGYSDRDRIFRRVSDARRLNLRRWRLRPVAPEGLLQCDRCGRLSAVSAAGLCVRAKCRGKVAAVTQNQVGADGNHYRSLYEGKLPAQLRAEEHTAQITQARARERQDDFKAGRIHVLSCSTTFELGVDLGDLDLVFLRNVPPETFNYIQRVGRVGRRAGNPGLAITFSRIIHGVTWARAVGVGGHGS